MAAKSKIRQSAKGENCQIRMPGICTFNPEETVLAHKGGAGLALKANDIHGSYSCYQCHMAIDGHIKTIYTKPELEMMFYDGMVRTQLILIEKGLISVEK